MTDFLHLVEQRILQAIEDGQFDKLPGAGKPLRLDDDSHVPEENRLAYRILKNSGFAPPEVELRREIATIEQLLAGMDDCKEKYRQVKKLNFLVMKLNMMRNAPVHLQMHERYEEQLTRRFGGSSKRTHRAK